MQVITGSDLTDPTKQKQVLEYFQALMNDEEGWKRCLQEVLSGTISDHQHLYLNLQVLENYLKNRYAQAGEGEKSAIRELLADLLKRQTNSSDPPFLKRKMAQLFALTFLSDFPERWVCFFEEVFPDLSSEAIIEFYLRVLVEIDTEIADREIHRTKEELKRNTLVKDNMRETNVPRLVESWAQILKKYSLTDEKIANLCLNVIGGYISWIDIGLIANENFVPLIVQCLKNGDTQEAACECVCSILGKGMDPPLKIQLVEAMDAVLISSGIYNVNEDTEVESVRNVAELINCLGTVLIDCWDKTTKAAQVNTANDKIMPLIDAKALPMLSCLRYDDVDVSGSVTEFAHKYILTIKTLPSLSEDRRNFVKDLLMVVLERYRFPEDYNHDKEGETEAEFLEYRKELKTVFMNIGLLDNALMMQKASEIVCSTLNNWRSLPFTDVSLAIEVLYLLGETLPTNPGAHFASNAPGAVTLKSMLKLLVTTDASQQTHPSSVLQYFECVVRYDKYFATEPQLLPKIVTSFLDQRGLHHVSGKVRSRVAYLFSRFVKQQKTAIMYCVKEILSQLGDLLAVSPDKSAERLISPEDQLFLYEATGTVIVFGNFPSQEKRMYMEQLLGSLVQKFEEGLKFLKTTTDEEEKKLMVEFLNNIMSYTSRTTKAFNNHMSMNTCNCSDLFLQLMGTFLNAVSLDNPALLDGLRQYLHRMILCLESELLPHLQTVLDKFLVVAPRNSMRSLQDFLHLVQQMISKFKASLVPYISQQMGGILLVVWQVLGRPHDLEDELIRMDLMYLRRAYYQLLAVSAGNKAVQLFTCAGSEVLEHLLSSLVSGATEVNDPLTQRTVFSVLSKLVDCVKEVPQTSAWLDPFIYGRGLAICFRAPFRPGFDFEDAQCVLVTAEISSCFKKFWNYKGKEFESFLTQQCFPELGLEPTASQQFILALTTADNKSFQKYLKNFFENHVKALQAASGDQK